MAEYDFEVEAGVPITRDRHVSQKLKLDGIRYPWDIMEIGDSFFIPFEGSAAEKNRRMNHATAAGNTRFGAGVISARSRPGGIRVWKISETENDLI